MPVKGRSPFGWRKLLPRRYGLEEYLETIYVLESEGVTVIGARVAEFMGVRAPSVTEAFHRMERSNLISVDDHVISLTPQGRIEAESVVRRHRVAERWLTDVLGFDWAKADEEANKLSHAFSTEVVERLSEIMGEPRTCPHGNPIPGNWPRPEFSGLRLDDAPQGVDLQVERVVEHAEVDAKLLRYLWGHGVVPGVHLTLLDKVSGAGTVTVELNGQVVSLGISAASKVQVRPSAPKPAVAS